MIIDELDAHLHPSWQRLIVRTLRETFPNVQFVASAHSFLVIAECAEDEVAVLRKDESPSRFRIETDPKLIGLDIGEVVQELFETDPSSRIMQRYLPLLGDRTSLQHSIAALQEMTTLTHDQETELALASTQLGRLDRADSARRQQARREDIEEYAIAQRDLVAELRARIKELEG